MSANLSLGPLVPDGGRGLSPGLQRWLEAVRGGGTSSSPAGALRTQPTATALATAAGATIAAAGAAQAARILAQDAAETPGSGDAGRVRPSLDRQALDAHAAVGELEARRQTFGTLERVFTEANRSTSAVETLEEAARRRRNRQRDQRVELTRSAEQAAQQQALARDSGTARRAEVVAAAAPVVDAATAAARPPAPPVDVAVAATSDAARELSRTADRLETLRMQSVAAIRATAGRVDSLAQEIASADRRSKMEQRRADAAQADRAADRRDVRRDVAARELVRLTGAHVQVQDDGALRVELGGRALVDAAGVHSLTVADPDDTGQAPNDATTVPSQEPVETTGGGAGADREAVAAREAERRERGTRGTDPGADRAGDPAPASGAERAARDDARVSEQLAQRAADRVADRRDAVDRRQATERSAQHLARDVQAQRLEIADRESANLAAQQVQARQIASDQADAVAAAMAQALARIGAADPTVGSAAAAAAGAGTVGAGAEHGAAGVPSGALRWPDGQAVSGISGVLAGQLAAAHQIVPEAIDGLAAVQQQFVEAVRGLALPGGPLAGQDLASLLHPLANSPMSTSLATLLSGDALAGGASAAASDRQFTGSAGSAAASSPGAAGSPRTAAPVPAAGGGPIHRPGTPVPSPGSTPDIPIPGTPGTSGVGPVDPEELAAAAIEEALATLAQLPAALTGLRDAAGDQAQGSQRRLDVLSVVDAVLAGAPAASTGGILSASLGATSAADNSWRLSQSGQRLVSSLQAVNALTASMGAVAGLAVAVGPTPPTVSISGVGPLVATPANTATPSLGAAAFAAVSGSGATPNGTSRGNTNGAAASGAATGPIPGVIPTPVVGALGGAATSTAPEGALGAWRPGAGVQVQLFSAPPELTLDGLIGAAAGAGLDEGIAPDSGSRTAPPGASPVPGWAGPSLPYEAQVMVRSIAAPAAIATATLPVGAVLNAGRGFSFALVTGAGTEQAQATSIGVGQGSRLTDVAAAINASGAAAHASVGAVTSPTGPAQRLVLTAADSGAASRLALVDGFGSTRPSALGATVVLDPGADSVLDVAWADGAAVRVTGPTTSLPGALPGVDLALRAGATVDAPQQLAVGVDADAAWQRVQTLAGGAAAVLDGLAGGSAIDAAAGKALAADPAITDLTSRIRDALGLSAPAAGSSGWSAGAAASSLAGALGGLAGALGVGGPTTLTSGDGTALATGAGGALTPVPGVALDHDQRISLDREAFTRAYTADPTSVESRVQSAARELLSVARETTDPRQGMLPVRIMGEQAYVNEYTVGSAGIDERMQYRQGALSERAEAMQSLLARLGQEQQWLGEQLA